ncbi:MAG: ribonuclease E activity regulator RraA [Nocardioides sp.]|uniref:ribonuclease E activity regulator RraA n=1 Tax=Nocardioides sp. TaxID=35761 RepID=UPI0039E2D1D0
MTLEINSDWRTADICDEHAEAACCETPFVSYGRRRRFDGTVSTVRCHEDNVLVRAVLSEPGDGRVLIVDGSGSRRVALLGDNMAELAVSNGWTGLVVNGSVRDVRALAQIALGVVAIGSSPRRSGKAGAGARDVPVGFGGVVFTPGDRVFVDDDGVVVMVS